MSELPHTFAEPDLFELARTHSSADGEHNNERLEFLGDAVLDLIVAEELFRCHPDLPEGALTELKAWVVSRRVLARASKLLGLDELARIGKGLAGRALPRSIQANLYEAMLGAVYLDAGFEAAGAFVRSSLAGPLERVRHRQAGPNPKQLLQRICQRTSGQPPVYELREERGSDHARAFLVAALAGGRHFRGAWGRTLKEAEHWAAHEALLEMEASEPEAEGSE